jgi:YidC/Oxa1 family membrane protein insertase
LGQIWDFLIVQPIAWVLRSFYNLTGNYGTAILLFAVAAILAQLYFNYKGKRGMLQQQRLRPKITELQKKYGKDRQKMQQAQAKLYQDNGVSMFGGCLWMFVPFPIIIALFGAVRRPLEYIWGISREAVETIAGVLDVSTTNFTYDLAVANLMQNPADFARAAEAVPEIAGLEPIHFIFLGLNLAEVPSFTSALLLIPIISAATSFLTTWLTQKFTGLPPAAGNSMMLMYLIGPGFSLWIGFTWPAVMGVYWIAQSTLRIPQEYFLIKYWNKKLDEEERVRNEREERRKAAEAAQKEEDRQRRSERIAEQNKKHKPKRYKLQNKPAPKEDSEE